MITAITPLDFANILAHRYFTLARLDPMDTKRWNAGVITWFQTSCKS